MPSMLSGTASGRRGLEERLQPSALAIAGTVHDLGNLIQVASSALNIAVRQTEMPSIQRKPLLDRARSSLDQAAALAQDAIRLISGRAASPELADISSVLLEVASMIDQRDNAGLVLHLEVEPDLPRIPCSSLGLQCAVLNLLNARDAMAGSGVVSITGKTILQAGEAVGVELVVTDRGTGMAPDTVTRALDPFFTTKTDGTGGIGLPMVDRFVREAGGTLAIESELGVGTSVLIRLPSLQLQSDGLPRPAAS